MFPQVCPESTAIPATAPAFWQARAPPLRAKPLAFGAALWLWEGMHYRTIILGAGAAGMMCAAHTGGNTLVIDHARNPGEKIRISGGGRCSRPRLAAATGDNWSGWSQTAPTRCPWGRRSVGAPARKCAARLDPAPQWARRRTLRTSPGSAGEMKCG